MKTIELPVITIKNMNEVKMFQEKNIKITAETNIVPMTFYLPEMPIIVQPYIENGEPHVDKSVFVLGNVGYIINCSYRKLKEAVDKVLIQTITLQKGGSNEVNISLL